MFILVIAGWSLRGDYSPEMREEMSLIVLMYGAIKLNWEM